MILTSSDLSNGRPVTDVLADTSDMLRIHRVWREALAAAPQLIDSVAPGDVARAGLVGSYYLNAFSLLHAHHDGEDELLTPRLLQRCPEQAATITQIAHQHVDVLVVLEAAEASIKEWEQDPSAERGASTIAALAALEASLTPHLDIEEKDIVPLAATCITAAEWAELPRHGMQHFAGDKPWLILGLIREQMTPEINAAMEAEMPPPMLEFWTTTGTHLFDDYMVALQRPS